MREKYSDGICTQPFRNVYIYIRLQPFPYLMLDGIGCFPYFCPCGALEVNACAAEAVLNSIILAVEQ